jgi:flagellar biosynthesis protein FlhG
MSDQATALRALAEGNKNHTEKVESTVKEKLQAIENMPKRARIITITSGKGGVGKTNCSAALTYYLHQRGRKVLLLDFDFGMGNTDLLLGNTDKSNITHLLSGNKEVKDVVVQSRYGFDFIKGVRDVNFADLPKSLLNKIMMGFREIESTYDDLIIDTGAGAHHAVIQAIMRSDVKLFIVKPERSSWEDAYQIVKHMRQKGYSKGFKILINMAKNKQMADLTAKNFVLTCEKSLKVEVQYLGYLLQDEKVAEAIRSGEIFLAKYPESSASLLFQAAFEGFEVPQALRERTVSYLEALFTNSG